MTFWHLPTGAIQPQSAVDSLGNVHLIYFKAGGTAEGGNGDLYYMRLAVGQARGSEPLRVNSQSATVGAVGTVRTAQIAVGRSDRVHVVWNGLGPKSANGYPTTYQAYARLNDAGTAFEPQRDLMTWAKGLDGGGSVAADKEGNVYVMLLVSHDKARTFMETLVDKWNIGACPMSTYTFAEGRNGVVAAWETRERIRYATLDPTDHAIFASVQVPGAAQKHPFLAAGANGGSLLVWTEGTGWQRGGALAWQILDKNGQPLASGRKADSVPIWGLASAYARSDGGFVVIY